MQVVPVDYTYHVEVELFVGDAAQLIVVEPRHDSRDHVFNSAHIHAQLNRSEGTRICWVWDQVAVVVVLCKAWLCT